MASGYEEKEESMVEERSVERDRCIPCGGGTPTGGYC